MRVSLAIAASLLSLPAFAYVGPGLGLGAIGVLLALLISVILALVGLFWYPLKRKLAKRKQEEAGQESGNDPDGA